MFPTTNIFAISILLMTNMTQGSSEVLRRFPDDEGGIADNRLLRRKAKSTNLGLYIGIGGGAVVLAGVGAFVIWKVWFSETTEANTATEANTDWCATDNPCKNNGKCSVIEIEGKAKVQCECAYGWRGEHCEKKKGYHVDPIHCKKDNRCKTCVGDRESCKKEIQKRGIALASPFKYSNYKVFCDKCGECAEGFTLVDGYGKKKDWKKSMCRTLACLPTITGCTVCHTENTCEKCGATTITDMEGFHPSSDGQTCVENKICFQEIPKCVQCDEEKEYKKCKKCSLNYHLNGDETDCRSDDYCKDQSRAGPLCETCRNESIHFSDYDHMCEKCKSEAFLDEDGKCHGPKACLTGITKIQDCTKCDTDDPRRCETCASGFNVSFFQHECLAKGEADPDQKTKDQLESNHGHVHGTKSNVGDAFQTVE